jgi:hypothetical protein
MADRGQQQQGVYYTIPDAINSHGSWPKMMPIPRMRRKILLVVNGLKGKFGEDGMTNSPIGTDQMITFERFSRGIRECDSEKEMERRHVYSIYSYSYS